MLGILLPGGIYEGLPVITTSNSNVCYNDDVPSGATWPFDFLCIQGERGAAGDVGAIGPRGLPGERGPSGPEGKQGEPVSAYRFTVYLLQVFIVFPTGRD